MGNRTCEIPVCIMPQPSTLPRQNISNNNNNSIQLFIIYVPSQQLQGQLQTQHCLGTTIIIIIGQNNLLIP
jgi:hypothetical protein